MGCCLALAVATVVSQSASGQAGTKPAATIPVVTTWDDLLKQPAVHLDKGVVVRLGIEATDCPRWSGVLLYAYCDGMDDTEPREYNRDSLGPLWLSVRVDGNLLDAKVKLRVPPRRFPWDAGGKRPMLFCRSLLIDRVGDYRLTVCNDEGKDIAGVVVRGTDVPFHPWSALLLVTKAHVRWEGDKLKMQQPARLTNLAEGIALPAIGTIWGLDHRRWDAQEASRVVGQKVPFGKGRLPRLVPDEASLVLQLTSEGDKLRCRVAGAPGFSPAHPDLHFLARWWINEKAFMPEPVDNIRCRGGNIDVCDENDARFELVLDHSRLGARSGDRVELQLLYCPGFWTVVVNDCRTTGLLAGPIVTRVTNRVAFTLR
jgi:hypothetical protein